LVGGTGGCPGTIDDPTPFLTTEQGCADIQGLFAERCGQSQCHSDSNAIANLDLLSPNPASRLVGVPASDACDAAPLVDTVDPFSSVLYLKLTDDYCGDAKMPLSGDPLSDDELECVEQWIMAQSGSASEGLDVEP
jgi:hypothetical protein